MKTPINLNTSNAIGSVEAILEKMEKLHDTINNADKVDGIWLDELRSTEVSNFFDNALKRTNYVIDFANELLEILERIQTMVIRSTDGPIEPRLSAYYDPELTAGP